MEKEQIIKALEYCTDDNSVCLHCPVRERCNNDSMFLEKEALSLIREQEKRIEELENICESYALQYGTVTDKEVLLKKERADTVRKMQNELKKTFSAICKGEMIDLFRIIDQIANKLLEDKS